MSLLHTLQPKDDDEKDKYISTEESSDEGRGPEVEATPIDIHDPPLALAPSLVLIVE